MRHVPRINAVPVIICISVAVLSGCFETDKNATNRPNSAFANTPTASAASSGNSAPTISGNPDTIAIVDSNWSFMPSASDPDSDSLTFHIANKPNWATFDMVTGNLSGQPTAGQEGRYASIRISVTDGDETAALPEFAVTVQNSNNPNGDGSNNAPFVSGTPPQSVTVGQAYSFTPDASDADGDLLTFAIANLPSWATFDSATGQLSGTPQQGDTAVYDNIIISVSDGQLMQSLAPFAINVSQTGTSAITLSWTPPTENEDGTPLTDLASYRIYYGNSEGDYPNEISVDNPGVTSYVVDNLTPNTYYFVSTSINSNGVESGFSNIASTVVN